LVGWAVCRRACQMHPVNIFPPYLFQITYPHIYAKTLKVFFFVQVVERKFCLQMCSSPCIIHVLPVLSYFVCLCY
jgi:hypothetical protein